jgi:hypothetical protein
MNRRNFLGSILAPFLVPLLPKDWRATKTLCSAKPVLNAEHRLFPPYSVTLRQDSHQHTPGCVIGCTGITVNHGHGPGDFDYYPTT